MASYAKGRPGSYAWRRTLSSRIKYLAILLPLSVLLAVLASACGPDGQTPQAGATAMPVAPGRATSGPASAKPTAQSTPGSAAALKYVQRVEDGALAVVNGQPITWQDYEPVLLQALASMDQEYQVNWEDPAMRRRLQFLQDDVLKQVVDRELTVQMAEKRGVVISKEQVDAGAAKQKSEIEKSGKYPSWEAFLESTGLTEGSYRKLIRESMVISAFTAKQQVDTQAEQVHLRHIAITDQAKADEVFAKLQSGADFVQLVAQYSEDTQTKDQGGDLGWFVRETMFPDMAAVAYSLSPGDFSAPIKTGAGYTIIQLIERAVRPVDASVLQLRQQQAMLAQVQAEKAQAVIEVVVSFAATPMP
jgi:foldase protein PrsA